ncbi:MAG TPA: hypothetical protein VG860_09560 [Terriglobia bacterium]|jgi:hypothetical protein|nr:hypothetical protein [Terriglobia bacterium]
MNSTKHYLLACAMMLAMSTAGWCQATVNEGLETAELYVDGASGSDGNPGTARQPLQTIGKAVSLATANNDNNIGTRVVINPGVYREAVTLSSNQQMTSMPITFEAAINGTVTVSGAQQWTGWQVSGGNKSIYTNPWPYSWGLCSAGSQAPPWPDIVMRREMVFVGGSPLTQVLSLNEMAVSTFYVNETSGTIYIWPPAGVNVNTADIEVSVNPTLWTIEGFSNIVLRGLTFEYANSCRENGAVLVYGPSPHSVSNVLFDTDNFLWNNAQGLNLEPSLTAVTVQKGLANHNGEAGVQAVESTYVLFQNMSADYNNWRGALGAYYNYNSSGTHFYEMHELTLNDLNLYFNETWGAHLDTDHEDVTASGLVASENYLGGTLIEKDEGPINISNSYFCNGNPTSSAWSNLGVDVRDSEYVTVSGTTFVGNAAGDVVVNGLNGGYQITNWQTGQPVTVFDQYITLMQNTFVAGASQSLFNDTYNWDWGYFQPTLTSNYNTWWNSANNEPYTIPNGNKVSNVDFAGWQASTNQDQQSTWAQPSGNLYNECTLEPDMVDYWFVTPGSLGAQTINPGSSAVWPVTIFPLRFTGNVTLSYDVSMVPGATASYGINVLAPNGTTNFTIQTASTTPAGTYQVVMIANSGNITKAITVLLTVQ